MDSQNLTGIVIITLPPEDNPSKGKTITAFTISDPQSNSSSSLQIQQEEQPQIQSPPSEPLHANTSSSSFFTTILNRPRRVLAVLATSLVVYLAWQSILSKTQFEFLREDLDESNRELNTVLFNLHPKWDTGLPSDAEVKLGKFVRRYYNSGIDRLKRRRKNNASMNSTAVSPVGGNVYPDGYVGKSDFSLIVWIFIFIFCRWKLIE